MTRLCELDRGDRLDKVDLGLQSELIRQLMRKGVRTTSTLFEIVSLSPTAFANEYSMTEPQLAELLEKLLELCGDCLMDSEHRDDLSKLELPVDDDLDDHEPFDAEPTSTDELIEFCGFSAQSWTPP